MVGVLKKLVLCVSVSVVLVALAGGSAAFALSPWWHLTGGSRPTYLRSGTGVQEVQEINVEATAGNVVVAELASLEELFAGKIELEQLKKAEFAYNATPSVVQAALGVLYGSGNVEVTTGVGSSSYRVTFKGALADRPLGLLITEYSTPLGGLEGSATTTRVVPGQPDGQLVVTAANLGDASTSGQVTIADSLPPGLEAVSIEAFAGGWGRGEELKCSLATVVCLLTGPVKPFQQIELQIGVNVRGAATDTSNGFRIEGGSARAARLARPVTVSGSPVPFGVEGYELTPELEGGEADTQAGSHPFQTTFTVTLNQVLEPPARNLTSTHLAPEPSARPKDLRFKLPPGLIGNPTPFPRCTAAQFHSPEGAQCLSQTIVGEAITTIDEPEIAGLATFTTPVFNLETITGEPARFGYIVEGVPIVIDTNVRGGEDYGITGVVGNIPQIAGLLSSSVTFWGVPGSASHDASRPPSTESHPPPFFELPTSCTGVLQSSVEGDSWQQSNEQPNESVRLLATDEMPALDGCNRLPFNPTVNVTSDGDEASMPTGLTVDVHNPQEESLSSKGLGEADVKTITVTLPEGVTINPAGADGLQACTEGLVGFTGFDEYYPVSEPGAKTAVFTPKLPGSFGANEPFEPGVNFCSDASKIGTVKINTPLLPNALEGAVYLASQEENPFGSLLAMYIVAEEPVSGVLVKLAGEIKLSDTGEITGVFRDSPQAPFEDAELHFFGGNRAPLTTPAHCGPYVTNASFVPWAAERSDEAAVTVGASSSFRIDSGPNGDACPGVDLPFNPSLTAGTTSIQAGGFSPFTMTMSRPDGSQNLQAIKLKMPPGLLGTLATVKLCPEAQANAGTCGPESLIGHTTVSVGVGGDPYSVTGGQVFITEGYGGAPYGLSIVNPAKAGPFDLGKVIVRAKIEVDPITAVLTITSDSTGPYKIPTILDGIPLQIQHVNVSIDRPGFTFNPTNCSPLAITGGLTSDQGSVKSLSVPFQITNCAVLAFKPKLTAKTAGKTSRASGASLSVKLTYPAGPYDANISKVKVDLPRQLPSRLTTLQKACPAATFDANPANCPSASIVGHAIAHTPVMPVPLTGPAYFVSHGGEAFPELVIVLQGYGATVHLIGSTFISKAGITSSTFKQVPDVPVGTFELTLPQGKFSALAANGNLCTTKKLAMPTSFVAQNGATIKTTTPITPTGCAKKAHKTKKHHKTPTHRRKK